MTKMSETLLRLERLQKDGEAGEQFEFDQFNELKYTHQLKINTVEKTVIYQFQVKIKPHGQCFLIKLFVFIYFKLVFYG